MGTYLQGLLGGQDLSEALASTNSQSISKNANLLDIIHGFQLCDMGLYVLGRIQLEALPLEGKHLIRSRHSVCLNKRNSSK